MNKLINKIKIRHLRQDLVTSKIYIQTGELGEESYLLNSLQNVILSLGKIVNVNEICNNLIFSHEKDLIFIYSFDANGLIFLKQLPVTNFQISKDFTMIFSQVISGSSYSLKFFDLAQFNQLFEFNYQKFSQTLLCWNNKIILKNESGTELFFYENDKLLFTNKIPLNAVNHFSGKPKTHQDFRVLTLYNNEMICNLNSDRILSIDINTGEILWELTEAVYMDSAKRINLYAIAMYGLVNSTIFVLQGSIYMEIDLQKHHATVRKDFSINIPGEDLRIQSSTLYKGKFYFTADIGMQDWKHNKFGVFDIETEKVLWIQTLDLPEGTVLNQKPVVDDTHIYLMDNKGTLYIFENTAVY